MKVFWLAAGLVGLMALAPMSLAQKVNQMGQTADKKVVASDQSPDEKLAELAQQIYRIRLGQVAAKKETALRVKGLEGLVKQEKAASQANAAGIKDLQETGQVKISLLNKMVETVSANVDRLKNEAKTTDTKLAAKADKTELDGKADRGELVWLKWAVLGLTLIVLPLGVFTACSATPKLYRRRVAAYFIRPSRRAQTEKQPQTPQPVRSKRTSPGQLRIKSIHPNAAPGGATITLTADGLPDRNSEITIIRMASHDVDLATLERISSTEIRFTAPTGPSAGKETPITITLNDGQRVGSASCFTYSEAADTKTLLGRS